MALVRRAARRIARALGYDLTRAHPPGADCVDLMIRLRSALRGADPDLRTFLHFCLEHLAESRADLLQDLFAFHERGECRGGYFVEFGATDGVAGSNSHLLETMFGWNGIVVEPSRHWHAALAANRRCIIDNRCVADESGKAVRFRECTLPELSSIDSCAETDRFAAMRRPARFYPVETVSLNDLLVQHGAPGDLDYLSVDTEGSELMILSVFDFDRFRPRVITVEHAYAQERRAALFDLLSRNGYRRKYEALSQIDDWYVLA